MKGRNERGVAEIHGGKVLVFGDLHLSSSFMGQHKNYQYECYANMDKIQSLVEENKASAVIFLGDLVGVNEKNIKDRQFLMRTQHFFTMLNKVTNGKVFSVKGNHDMGDFTDFDFFEGLGYIKNPEYIDYYRDDSNDVKTLEIRFHLVNYGDEKKRLHLADENWSSNVVLGHSDYYIDGVTNWYSANNNIEVSDLTNFEGVQYIFSGHIHTPSEEMLFTTLKNGESIGLFFLGSPSRTSERFDDCWYMVFEYKVEDGEGATSYDSHLMGLEPASEVFYDKDEFVGEESEEEEARQNNSDKLTSIVKEIMDGRIMTGDIQRQIEVVPYASDEVKAIAKKYLEMASQVK